MTSGLHMENTGAQQALQGVADSGKAIGDAWNTAQSAINGAAAGLGQGPLGAAFQQNYQAQTTDVGPLVTKTSTAAANLSAAGFQSAGDYTQTDGNQAAMFNNIR